MSAPASCRDRAYDSSTHNLSRSAGTNVSTGAYGFPPRLAAVGEVLVPALASISTSTSSKAKARESEVAPAQTATRKNVRRSHDDRTRPLADGSVATMAAQAASKDSMVHCVWSEILNTYACVRLQDEGPLVKLGDVGDLSAHLSFVSNEMNERQQYKHASCLLQ